MWSESIRMFDPCQAFIKDESVSNPNPHYGEFWIARLRLPGCKDATITIVKIITLGENGNIGFIPFGWGDNLVEHAEDWALFELIEKIEMEKYK